MILFIGRALVDRFSAISWAQVRFSPAWLVLAGAVQVVMMFLAAVVFRHLLAPLCRPPRWPAMFAATWIGRVGKYLPGKFASLVGTVWLLRREGVPVPVAASVVFLRQGMLMVMGLLAAVPLTMWQPVVQRLPLAWLWCVALLSAGLVFLHPRVFFALSNHVLGRLRLPPLRTRHRYSHYVGSLAIVLVNLVLGGVGLWLIARSVTDVSVRWLPVFVSAAALAGSVGFLAVFAPAGLGVREGILLIILEHVLSPGEAALVVVASRLMQVVAEAVMAGAGGAILRFMPEGGRTVD